MKTTYIYIERERGASAPIPSTVSLARTAAQCPSCKGNRFFFQNP